MDECLNVYERLHGKLVGRVRFKVRPLAGDTIVICGKHYEVMRLSFVVSVIDEGNLKELNEVDVIVKER